MVWRMGVGRVDVIRIVAIILMLGSPLSSQNQPSTQNTSPPRAPSGSDSTQAPLVLTLQDALERAKTNEPQFRAALTNLGVAHQDVVESRAGLLPSVNYSMQFIYTQGGSPSGQRFVANNGVHEYVALGNVHQALSPGMLAEHRRVEAAEALARAKSEIAARGLAVTVVGAYYGHVVAQRKFATAQKAASEADRFFSITQKLETGGEVAHSDVIKAQIQDNQQQRELQEARLGMDKSHLDLAILLFPDFNPNFTVVDDLRLPDPLPSFAEVENAGTKNNPEIRGALATLRQADQGVKLAWAAMLPSVALDYFYGIDANQMAVHNPEGFRNLGYSATATLELPVWNWGAGHARVRQASLQREQAHVELNFTQRRLLANLRSFYDEAEAARSQLALLSQSAELAADGLRLTTLRYQAGEASVLEVVDAQNTVTQARNAYDDGQMRFQIGLANLETLTGKF